jgi:coiled-coil domain-containing protein 12
MGDRKSRLAALAAKAGRTIMPNLSTEAQNRGEQATISESKKSHSVSFRNYAPNDENLAGDYMGNEDEEGPDTKRQRVEEPSISTALQDALKEAKQEVASTTFERRLLREGTATPKKINWDLLRDIHDKLNKLEKRTQKAIVEMLKERLEKEAAEQANSDDSDLD